MKRPALSWILRNALTVAFCAALSAASLHAQVDTGSITGIVTDASGAVVGTAKVTLTNEGTGASLTTATGTDGGYSFSPVRIGSYKLEASAQGFRTVSQIHVTVNVSSNVVANFNLQPGSVTETIEVTSAAPVLQAEDASVGQVVEQRSVNNLPLNGRNFTFLAQLAAGVNTPQADTRGNASTGAFAANGNRPAQNNYMLDGIDNNSDTVDFLNGTNYVVLPPVDAIQEFKVQTSDFSAEFGRSGAAVLNATIKSGTNSFHGAAWEFFRNDKLDAADYFEDAGGIKKGELRQNQFGFSGGGPIIKNKVFFFGDYEGLRRVQGTVLSGTVPTTAEVNSGFTNLTDLITQTDAGTSCGQTVDNATMRCDALGRMIPSGTVLDPATTRTVTNGVADPVTGLISNATGYVRDPFGNYPILGTTDFTGAHIAAYGLNQLPGGRLDPNAIALLKLYPVPTSGSLFSNFTNSPKLFEHRNSFDTRLDLNLSNKNQVFYRFSYVDDPNFIPGIFGGVADGGGFQQGNQTALAQQSALAWTHVFSPNLVNVARAGLNYLHTTRVSPSANDLTDIPSTYGIQNIPQLKENGGLPAFGINGLQTLGSNAFLPSDEVSSTFQITDDLTKIYGKHTFKMGMEWQHVKFSTLQPPWSRGEFDYNGDYTDIANVNGGSTGRADFLLTPTAAQNGGTIDFVGGSSQIYVSNISLTDNGKNYVGAYVNDDWKVTPKLTVNLGLRWDFFGLVYEHHGNQANFVPSGPPTGNPMYIVPSGTDPASFSSSFSSLFAADGITLALTDKYGKGMGNSQKSNFAPRIGFAYQVTPKLVARGGFGMFYNGFENRGFSPNLGENYPFQFNFSYSSPDDGHPIQFPGCAGAAATGFTAAFETGFSCTPLDPGSVLANGLGLRGIQFDYQTPYTMSGNFTLQYQLTPTLTVQAGYVTSLARHLEVFPGSNNPTQILPINTKLTNTAGLNGSPGSGAFPASQGGLPFPDFGGNNSYATTTGNSFYHSLQTKVEKRFASGLNFLATYTWSKTRTDAIDLLNGGSGANYRAPNVEGLGIHFDYGLAPFDVRNVFHLSGGYELPFGKGKRFLGSGGMASKVFGGWSVNATAVLQGGQPITLTCPSNTVSTTAGANCYDFVVSGQDQKRGLHIDSNGKLSFFGNPAAFAQPAPCTALPCPVSALGGPPDQIAGPPFKRLDFSTFKDFQLTERFSLQFRAEFFNILNHPNFNAPGFGGNGVVAVSGATNFTSANFGEIGSTRDAPYDPRQIQFALKLYY
jgi:hypothetical protein